MQIELPTIPLGMMTLLAFFAPFAIAVINHPAWPSRWKYVVTIIVNAVLVAVVFAVYYAMTKEPIPDWPVLLVIGLGVTQAAYLLLWKKPAAKIEEAVGSK